MVRAFATAGADVVITSRKRDACEAAAAEVRDLGRRALPVAAHVGRDRQGARSAIGRPGKPEEIVSTALYLASDASSYTTGALIRVDSGLYRG